MNNVDKSYALGEQMIFDNMYFTNNLYIDMEFLKYIKLGKIISHPKITSTIFNKIVDLIKEDTFTQRKTDDTETLFGSIPEFLTLLDEKELPSKDVQFAISPTFEGAIGLVQNTLNISDTNKRLKKDKRPTKVTIDISSIKDISKAMIERITYEYNTIFQTEVSVLRDGLESVDKDSLAYDTYFIADLSKFNRILLDQLNKEKLANSHLFCSKLLPLSKIKETDPKILDMVFSNIELVMTAAIKFHYVQPLPCLT